jgi:Putative adhesin
MSRASIVVMLIAAEILVVGMAIYAVGHGRASLAAGLHRADFSASAIAPIAVGATPHVVIDDAASRVRIGVSNDELVHVRDLTQMHGALFSSSGAYPRLKAIRTADGVRIERARVGSISIAIFGWSTQAIEVDVPAGSRLEIAQCAGADVNGVTGGVSVHSLDGHVTLTDLQGSVDARSDDGYIKAANVRGDHLALQSMDGHLALENVAVASLDGSTRDGRIEADGLSVTGNSTLQTSDGSIRARFAPNADLTIDASARDGRISVDGSSLDQDDAAQRTVRLGAGTGQLRLATDDGSIHIFTNGALQ